MVVIHPKPLVAVAALLQSPVPVTASQVKGASPIDALRNRYLQQERRAWTIVNQIDAVDNQLEQDATQQRATVMRELVDIYLRFAETELDPEDRGEYQLLARLAEWHLLEQNLLTINKLFEVVYNFLRNNAPRFAEQAEFAPEEIDQQGGGPIHSDDLRLLTIDLAETILFDKRQPVAAQLEQIYTIMVRQALYYRASMVHAHDPPSAGGFGVRGTRHSVCLAVCIEPHTELTHPTTLFAFYFHCTRLPLEDGKKRPL